MKKFYFLLILLMLTTICQAQTGHLKFMGISIDGDLNTFVNKLVLEKGFKITPLNEGEEYVSLETIKLIGDYGDFRNAKVFVNRHRQLANVSSVYVEFDATTTNKGLLQKEIERYDHELGKNEKETMISITTYKWETDEGNVEVFDSGDLLRILFIDYPQRYIVKKTPVAFSNAPELITPKPEATEDSHVFEEEFGKFIEETKEKQTVREICSIPFGSSYQKAERILANKYGVPESKDVNRITYKNKSYGGISFNHIHFLFQSDGTNSYFNGCSFIIDAKSLAEANKHLERLHDTLSDKYMMASDVDSNENKVYFGGYPPTAEEKLAFLISIIKYDKDIAKFICPYSVRLMYGPFNYVKEDF